MKNLFLITLIVSMIGLTSCASIVSGDSQIVSVETPDCAEASCTLTNKQGTFYVASTPETVTVNKSTSTMFVECSKGNLKEVNEIESSTAGMAFGNILAGGVIGAAVDMGTGAAYKYPDVLVNTLKCP